MQGNHDGLNEEIDELERRELAQMRALRETRDELTQLREQERVAHMTPEERHQDVRRRTAAIGIVRRALAAIGILLALDWLRATPKQSLTAMALTAGAVAGSVGVVAPDGQLDVWPEGPPSAIAEAPKAAAPTPLPEDDDAPAPTDGSSLGSGELRASPPSTSFLAVPTSTPSPSEPTTPAPTGAPPPNPSASPSPTRPPPPSPPPSPTATPTVTASPTPSPSPSPTVTASPPPSPTPSPTQVDEPLVCVDVDQLLEACLDLELPVLDGLMGRPRILYG